MDTAIPALPSRNMAWLPHHRQIYHSAEKCFCLTQHSGVPEGMTGSRLDRTVGMWKVIYMEILKKAEEDNGLVKKRKGKLGHLPLAAYVEVVYNAYVSLKESDGCHLHCHLLPPQLQCFIFSVQQHLVALEEE